MANEADSGIQITTVDQRLYKTYVRAQLTYTAPAWYALTSAAQRLTNEARQNLALQVIVEAERYIRNDAITRDLRVEFIEKFVVCWRVVCTNAPTIDHIST